MSEMITNTEVLITERTGSVLLLTMNRPAVYNALNEALKHRLLAELTSAAKDPAVRCVVITGAGRAFSSGQDLRELEPGRQSVREALRATYHPIVRVLRDMEKPILAAVNGVAAGAGCSLALACDLRLVAASAGFSLAFSNIGLVPDAGATYFLPRLIGLGAALEMAFSGRTVGADEALHLGLATRVVPDGELLAQALELAGTLALRPTRALGLAKRALLHAATADLEDALEYEAALQEVAARTADFQEGVAAFRAKRVPVFEGH